MTDLRGDGNIRVTFVPHVQDPAAPTPAELAAGVDAGIDFAGIAPELECVECDAAPRPVFPSRERYFAMTIRADTHGFRRAIRQLNRNFRRMERLMRRSDPRLTAMHADYARRRKARNRRRR